MEPQESSHAKASCDTACLPQALLCEGANMRCSLLHDDQAKEVSQTKDARGAVRSQEALEQQERQCMYQADWQADQPAQHHHSSLQLPAPVAAQWRTAIVLSWISRAAAVAQKAVLSCTSSVSDTASASLTTTRQAQLLQQLLTQAGTLTFSCYFCLLCPT